MSENRRAKGASGEQIAADFLCRKGYTVLCRNFTVRGGELDIVALCGDFVQLIAKHIAQVAHRFHTHTFLLSHACRVTIRFALATSIACALVFFSATVTQHPRGTSTNAEADTLK